MEINSDRLLPPGENIPPGSMEGGGKGHNEEKGSAETEHGEPAEKDLDTQEAEIISSQRPIEEKVKALTELLKKRIDQELGIGDLSRAQEGIRNGKTLNKIKEFVKKSKAKGGWGEYTKKYLSTISERTIQNWMHAGKSPHFRRYAGMGLERLLKVDRLSKAHGGTDPITAFLKDAGIKPIPEGGRVSMENKRQADAAIAKAHAIAKAYRQPPKKSAVNLLADRLIEQLAESLKHDDTSPKSTWGNWTP